jgi:hypothetical protein
MVALCPFIPGVDEQIFLHWGWNGNFALNPSLSCRRFTPQKIQACISYPTSRDVLSKPWETPDNIDTVLPAADIKINEPLDSRGSFSANELSNNLNLGESFLHKFNRIVTCSSQLSSFLWINCFDDLWKEVEIHACIKTQFFGMAFCDGYLGLCLNRQSVQFQAACAAATSEYFTYDQIWLSIFCRLQNRFTIHPDVSWVLKYGIVFRHGPDDHLRILWPKRTDFVTAIPNTQPVSLLQQSMKENQVAGIKYSELVVPAIYGDYWTSNEVTKPPWILCLFFWARCACCCRISGRRMS